MMRASEVARHLGVSAPRISQLVADGRLDGCFTGAGPARRFDLEKVVERLGRALDKGQMLGNGAETRRRLRELQNDRPDAVEAEPLPPRPAPEPVAPDPPSELLPVRDPDRYELARTLKVEEEARRLRRQNEQDAGTFVLAQEVERATARLLGREIAEFEAVLREGARNVADRLGVDFKTVRAILIEAWRAHRGQRAGGLATEAEATAMTEAEKAADV